jgi:hypothetical protein
MGVDALALWVLSVMLSAVPPGKSRHPMHARESVEAGRERYAQIARAIAEVSNDPDEEPLFDGSRAREKTAALLLAISYYESHWRRDVDLGIGPQARGGGRYHCMMQIAVDRGRTPEGWTGEELEKNRVKCFRSALHILQRGKRFCRGRGMLNHYATGRCNHGRQAVAKRWRVFDSWLQKHPFPNEGRAAEARNRPR